MINRELADKIVGYLRPHNPLRVGVFGSYVRNEQTADSDLDILVSFRDQKNILDLIGLEMELSELLGIKVDLITEASVSPYLQKYIQQDLQVLCS
jgi:predicted nucleotidyltransferase